MTFELTKEQEMLLKLVREFAQNEVAPLAEEIDRSGRFPLETVEKMSKVGLFGLNIPEAYGGVGMSEVCKVLAVSEMAKACASTAEMYAVQLLVNAIISMNGNDAQKKEYFGRTLKGELGAFALTEPGAGSDAGSLQTVAVKEGNHYVINGTKCFISNLGPEERSYAIVIALTDPAKKTHGGMTAFLVDRDNPGFKVGKTEDKMGIRAAAVSELILEDCIVDEDHLKEK